MPQSEPNRASEAPDFVLKHRITGAAVLLFFGALVLPWILGAPGGADAVADTASAPSISENSGQNAEAVGAGNSVANLAQALAEETVQVEEQVYISRITPLDADSETSEPVSSTPSEPTQASTVTASSSDVVEPAQAEKQASSAVGVSTTANRQQSPAPTVAAKKSETQPTPTKNSDAARPSVRPTPQAPEVDVGWVVQVGVFTDQRGAKRVVEDLRSKGFTPSTTIVDTNRGKATGTRIWLGPYAQRVDAAKAKSELTEKTGEAGFIRAYP